MLLSVGPLSCVWQVPSYVLHSDLWQECDWEERQAPLCQLQVLGLGQPGDLSS